MKSLVVALLLLAAAAPAEEAVWMLPAVVPAVIPDGPFAGQGGSEIALRALGAALPQFAWHYEVTTPMRELHDIAKRDGLCSWGFAKLPEREKFMIFSNRPMTSPGYGVILREDRADEFRRFLDASGAVDLDRLAEAKTLSGGYPAGRPQAAPFKAFVEARQDKLTAEANTVLLFRQLKARHLDYLLGTRDEAFYFAASLGDVPVIALPIAGMPRFGLGYIACSKGPIGQKVITAVDDYLDDDAHWATFLAPWERWMSAADFTAAVRSPVIKQAP